MTIRIRPGSDGCARLPFFSCSGGPVTVQNAAIYGHALKGGVRIGTDARADHYGKGDA
jgi:hypothetical protein